jgi:hypothetical protein
MPVCIREDGLIGLNAPARVRRDDREVVKDPCPNHEYRHRAKRKGQTARLCRLCLDQQEMSKRWKDIRKAFITVRSSTRKRSAAPKPAVISVATKQWKFSIVASLRPDSTSEAVRVLIGIDCGQKVLSND